ncbi:MAG: toxin-antitoxin system, antitoxin component [Elusimicrobiota bacterium]|jgi:hypothetical protein|nr:toxin-antitoxin system, antitoxin component [Elusimicrobiota bacterium]
MSNISTLKKIEKNAKQSKISESKWARNNITTNHYDDYPDGFFELFGSAKDDSFKRPNQIDFKYDYKREKIVWKK